MSVIHRAQITIGDSSESAITIGYHAEVISALHQALFDHFASTGLGVRVTFHIAGKPDIERHFFLTPDRPVHFVYVNGKRPELDEDCFKTITGLIEAGQIVHLPLDGGAEDSLLASAFAQTDEGPQEA